MNHKELHFLIDESCDYGIVITLRDEGFQVISVVESFPGTSDIEILQTAVASNSVLITEDCDFGEWIFAHKENMRGVIYIRYPSNVRSNMLSDITKLVHDYGKQLERNFTVLEPGRARIRKLDY